MGHDGGGGARPAARAACPIDAPVGLFHGDYQTSNLLFDDRGVFELEAVLDWEISGIGGHRLDIGWLLMMNDPQSWYDAGSFAGGPDLDALEARYEEGVGTVGRRHRVVSRPLGVSIRSDQRTERDAAPHRQAARSRVGAHRALGARSCSGELAIC